MVWKLAVLDDYQQVAHRLGDWSLLDDVEVTFFQDRVADQGTLVERLAPFDIVVAMRERTPLPAAVIERLPRLRLLVTTGSNNDVVDLDACARRGIPVSCTRYVLPAAAEMAWALILAVARRVVEEDANVRAGVWQTGVGVSLHGKVLGIVGLGKLGTIVARVGHAFGMQTIAWSPNLTAERAADAGAVAVSKDELFERADVVSIHLRSAPSTKGIVDAEAIGRMKSTAILVNTSRGPVLDQDALTEALAGRAIGGAGLDVFCSEPLPASHPLTDLDNVVLTPHIGYVTDDNYRVFFADVVEDVRAFLDGAPVRLLNAEGLRSDHAGS